MVSSPKILASIEENAGTARPGKPRTMRASQLLVKGYTDFSLKLGPVFRTCLGVKEVMCAHFRLDTDISPLFPHINSVAQKATFFEKPLFIKKYQTKGILAFFKACIRGSKAKLAYRNAQRLTELGILTPKPIAIFERLFKREAYLMTEYIEGILNIA